MITLTIWVPWSYGQAIHPTLYGRPENCIYIYIDISRHKSGIRVARRTSVRHDGSLFHFEWVGDVIDMEMIGINFQKRRV